MKIAVVTPGRSHLLNMSKELIRQGHDVTFYTMVPSSRCEAFGLPKKNIVSFFWICAPLMLIFRKMRFPFDWNRYVYYAVVRIVDALAAWRLQPCDLLIGISGCAIKSSKKARRKYGAKIGCDRGCKHILSQKAILDATPNAETVFPPDIPKELEQYELADYMALPSVHSRQSFIDNGVAESKLFVNPYGVNIENFKPTALKQPAYDVIFVGIWCFRKGVDVLVSACQKFNLSLLHVGPLGDAPFPEEKLFTHIDPVEESRLPKFYEQAKVLCLPSREDGFGLVLFQAMRCGLPLVYSSETGGPDLRNLVSAKEYLFEFSELTPDALGKTLKQALDMADTQSGVRNYLTDGDLNNISWEAYGSRYNQFLKSIF